MELKKKKKRNLPNDLDPLSQESESVKDLVENKKIIKRNESQIKYVNQNYFDETINKEKAAIVIYGAQRCSHCEPLIEVMEVLLEEEFKEVNCYYMDLDKNKDFAEKYEIFQLPRVSFYSDGEKVYEFMGEKSYDEIAGLIEKYLLEVDE